MAPFESFAKNTVTNVTKKLNLLERFDCCESRDLSIQQTLIVNNPIEMNLPADVADENNEYDQVITMKAGSYL